MALIRCPECNREISDKATACPGCGYPMTPAPDETTQRLEAARKKDESFLKKATLGFFVAVLVFLGLVYVLSHGA